MTPYVPGKPISEVQRELGLEKVVKLASNENPLGPSPLAIQAVKQAADSMHIYPDASGFALREKLAQKHGLNKNNIFLGNGSDELIHMLGCLFLAPGDNLVVADPTFVRYHAAAELADVEIRKVPLDKDLRHDLPAMASACDERTKLIFVANPHNPTGTVVSKSEINQLIESLPSGTTLVLDEAYFEYASDLPDFPSGIDYVKTGKQVICLRTFSKSYGLAGIRIGYGFAAAELVDAFDRAREPFNANSLAQVAALAALDDENHLAESRKVNRDGLKRITEAMAQHGLKTIPSHANFICIDLGQPAKPVFEALLQKGVIVRTGEPLGLPTFIRVSIGTPDEVSEFLTAFESIRPIQAEV